MIDARTARGKSDAFHESHNFSKIMAKIGMMVEVACEHGEYCVHVDTCNMLDSDTLFLVMRKLRDLGYHDIESVVTETGHVLRFQWRN